MLKKHHRFMVTVLGLLDLGMTYAALALAYYARFYSDQFVSLFPVEHGLPPLSHFLNPVVAVIIAAVWLPCFHFNGLYHPRRGRSTVEEIYAVFNAILMGGLVLIGVSFFYRDITYSRAVAVSFFVIDFLLVCLSRLTLRSLLREMRRRGFNLRHIMIAGAGELGRRFAEKLQHHPEVGLKLVGWVDDDPSKIGRELLGARVMGTLDDVVRLLGAYRVDQLYIALPLSAYRRFLKVLGDIRQEGVQVKVIPDLMQYITFQAGIEDFDGIPVINLTQTPLRGWNSMVKRIMDIALAALAIIGLAPLLALIIALIKLDSRGPVFYRQERMGLDRRRFMIFKFRSMHTDAEEHTGPVFARAGDPRVTRVGRVLRSLSLDELPQLLNVLKGEMSLVGPRPERPPFVMEFKQDIPNYMIRHQVKSGMTGWAQVNGLRGNTCLEKRLEYDLFYIRNWSLLFDVYIIFLTFFTLHKNAV
ncbi:MAG: undecaprenyl-phosphate glucose phosphotransferase [Candidatus Schekmanbacteria bacterium]|nr:undecaprenyl-phosphate glucose phosphotransferase [Candidatus Schekmanbacteria bacterium]